MSENANAALAKRRGDDAGNTSAITVRPASQPMQPFDDVSQARPKSNLKSGHGHVMVTAGQWLP